MQTLAISLLLCVTYQTTSTDEITFKQIKRLRSQMNSTSPLNARTKKMAEEALKEIARKLSVQLEDRDELVRFQAASLLAEIGRPAASRVYWIKLGVFDESDRVRAKVAIALGEMREKGKTAVRNLMYLLEEDKVWFVRGNAATAMGRIGGDAESAVPTLVKALLKDPSPDVRGRAAASLGAIAKMPNIAVPALVKAMNDTMKNTRQNPQPVCFTAVRALQRFGREAKSAVPALLNYLAVRDQQMRAHVILTLGYVGADSKTAISTLRKIMRDPKERLWWGHAARAIGRIGPDAKEVLPDLLNILKHHLGPGKQDYYIGSSVLQAIGKMRQNAIPAVPYIMQLCQSPDRRVRRDAFLTLGAIGPEAKESLLFLITCLNDKKYLSDPIIPAIQGLGRMAVPALITNLMTETNKYSRRRTIQALGFIGPHAKSALPVLESLRGNGDFRVEVLIAIDRINGTYGN